MVPKGALRTAIAGRAGHGCSLGSGRRIRRQGEAERGGGDVLAQRVSAASPRPGSRPRHRPRREYNLVLHDELVHGRGIPPTGMPPARRPPAHQPRSAGDSATSRCSSARSFPLGARTDRPHVVLAGVARSGGRRSHVSWAETAGACGVSIALSGKPCASGACSSRRATATVRPVGPTVPGAARRTAECRHQFSGPDEEPREPARPGALRGESCDGACDEEPTGGTSAGAGMRGRWQSLACAEADAIGGGTDAGSARCAAAGRRARARHAADRSAHGPAAGTGCPAGSTAGTARRSRRATTATDAPSRGDGSRSPSPESGSPSARHGRSGSPRGGRGCACPSSERATS